jgi:hypothetical protein
LGASVSQIGVSEEKKTQPDSKANRSVPRVINVDKNAAYPKAIAELKVVECSPSQLNFDR